MDVVFERLSIVFFREIENEKNITYCSFEPKLIKNIINGFRKLENKEIIKTANAR